MSKSKELGLGAVLTMLGVSVVLSASLDMSLLKTGKTYTGTILGFPYQAVHTIPKINVTLLLESVSPSSAKIQISWSKHDVTGESRSQTCEAQIGEESGLPKLSCKTNKDRVEWEFTFHPDGRVHCRREAHYKGAIMTGYLK